MNFNNSWSCMVTAAEWAFGVDAKKLVDYIGHDGSSPIVIEYDGPGGSFELREPHRGFTIYEVSYALMGVYNIYAAHLDFSIGRVIPSRMYWPGLEGIICIKRHAIGFRGFDTSSGDRLVDLLKEAHEALICPLSLKQESR